MNASASAMKEHWVRGIAEVSEGKIGGSGEEDVDGKKGREKVGGEVIEGQVRS